MSDLSCILDTGASNYRIVYMHMKPLKPLGLAEAQKLIHWYHSNKRPFPWRQNPNPYWVWLAEVMSQQTQMSTLLLYFERFIERFPTVQSLAQAPLDEVLSLWTGLGYYSRARNLHLAAQQIAQAGAFPQTYDQWLKLPGIGPYSAAAVSSQCHGEKKAVVDGNVIRVVSRIAGIKNVYSSNFRATLADELAHTLINIKKTIHPGDFNQALMELGATVCKPKGPSCGACPLNEICWAHQQKKVEEYPPPKPRKEIIKIKPKVFVYLYRPATVDGSQNSICNNNPINAARTSSCDYKVLLTKRPPNEWFSGMYDFPSELGGVLQPIKPRKYSGTFFGYARHHITHHKILLEGRFCVLNEKKGQSGIWVSLDDLIEGKLSLPIATTTRKMLKPLMQTLNQLHGVKNV